MAARRQPVLAAAAVSDGSRVWSCRDWRGLAAGLPAPMVDARGGESVSQSVIVGNQPTDEDIIVITTITTT